MFDLTPALPVDSEYRRTYLRLRAFLYALFFVTTLFVGLRFIFPDEQRFFDFRIYFGPKNTLADPRLETGVPVKQGILAPDEKMLWNASAVGAFSVVRIRLNALNLNTEEIANMPTGTISLVRAYRAFLYPTGDPVRFRSGTLITDETRYGIVSENTLRPFASLAQAEALGWSKASFTSVSPALWKQQTPGVPIPDQNELIEDSLFRISGNYYQVKKGELVPFASERAYRSRFPSATARTGSEDLLGRTTQTETMIGFLDGTLLSYDQSVYAVEGETLRPIASADTFLEKGYGWEAVIAATGEEFGTYVRGKLYTRAEPHPDGTLFFSQPENRSYLVENGTKRPIPNDVLLAQYASLTPVIVDNVPEVRTCAPEYVAFWQRFECEIALDAMEESRVGEYQFAFIAPFPVRLEAMRADFIRSVDERNLRYFLTDLRQKIAFRYEQ